MADKAIPDISLGGAEQNMSREELAAVCLETGPHRQDPHGQAG